MSKLTAARRKALPASDFAVKGRRYPVEDASHARNALARVAQHGTPAEKAAVKRKVRAKFTGIAVEGKHSQGYAYDNRKRG